MNRYSPLFRVLVWTLASVLSLSRPVAAVAFDHFVTRSADKLHDGPDELRFISTNMPDVLQIITNTGFDSTNNLRVPDDYELRDAVLTVKQMGGQVLRTFSITAKNGPGAEHLFNVATNPVVPNEAAFQALDRLLQLCNEEGVRVYLPLIAYSNANRGDPSTYGSDFWVVGSATNLKFKNMVSQLLNRTNTLTGVRYKDDKAILGWQSGNELVIGTDAIKRTWLHDLAAYVKSLDANHLFIDGRNRPDDVYELYDEFFADPNIDVVSYHTYVNLTAFNTPASTLNAVRQYTAGKKALIVSEIAMYTTEAALTNLLDAQIANGTSGSNWWGHRFRNREGGFYRHSDNGSLFEDLNWPGFPGSASYLPDIQKALNLQNILASHAWQIQGRARPPLPVPEAPFLLPIADTGHISWEGPTGAQAYDIERAPTATGPWTILASDYPEHLVVADWQFADLTAETGQAYHYRVIAKNSSGASAPSNVVGPVAATTSWLVDNFFALSRTFATANVGINKAYNHYNYSNDLALLVRNDPAAPGGVTYCLDGFVRNVTAYLHQSTVNPTISASSDGVTFTPLSSSFTAFGSRKLFVATAPEESAWRYVRIELNTPSASEAIGRIEIEYTQPAGTARAPLFSPAAGTYSTAQAVTLASTTPGAAIRYTTNGATPTATLGLSYTGPIEVAATTTIKAVAYRDGLATSLPSAGTFVIGAATQTVLLEAEELSPVGFGAGVSVESDPPASAGRWSKLNGTAVGQYTEFTTPPLPPGTYDVIYRYKTGGPRAQYTFALDGTLMGGTIDPYAATSFYLSENMGRVTFATASPHVIRLVITGKNAASSGYLIGSDSFTFVPVAMVAAPVFDQPDGSYHQPITVTLSTATPGASIRYSTDGSVPTVATGLPYTGPLGLAATTTIKAVAFKAGLADSALTISRYEITDNTPPAISVPADITVEATGPAGARVDFVAEATDDFDGIVPVTATPASGSTFPVGTSTVHLGAQDSAGNQASASFRVTVTDTQPPVFSSLSASPNSIWPPNKKMVPVTLTAVATDIVGVTSLKIVSVTCNEAVTGAWTITGPLTLTVMADRAGAGSGRVYTITVEARDAAGNATQCSTTVSVPHDQGHNP
jgi:hypothetical protein